MRLYFTNLLLIALSVAFLAHLGLIALWGEFTVREPHPGVLAAEIGMFILIIGFALGNIASRKRR